ncbi:SRPBCC family protein [Mucilaginibacter sp. AW1-3]
MPDTTLHQNQYNTGDGTTAPIVNLEWPERVASVALGTRMAFGGLSRMFRHPLRSALRIFAGGYLVQRGVTGHCEVYTRLGKTTTEPVNVNIKYTFTVNRNRQDVYDFWRRLENLPLFMSHLDNIQVISDKYSHWEAKIPGNIGNISWDAEIVEDIPGSHISWQSLPDATINNTGKVEFEDAPGQQGTIVKVVISYLPPAGGLGTGLAKLLNPVFERLVRQDVLSFKDYMEIYSTDDRVTIDDECMNAVMTDDVTIVTIMATEDEPPVSAYNPDNGDQPDQTGI